jgi:hypothetical protein
MKSITISLLVLAGLMQLPSSAAANPEGYLYSNKQSIATNQSVSIYGSFYADSYDNTFIDSYNVYVDGNLVDQQTNLYTDYASFWISLNGEDVGEGFHSVYVDVVDIYGNTSSFSAGFNVAGYAYTINLRSINGYYVCAEGGGGREVVANRYAAGPWETFTLLDTNGGSLESGDTVNIQSISGYYLCAEGSGGREVVANRYQPYSWEQFVITNLSTGGTVSSGHQIAIQVNNGQYWCAENGGGSVVNANRSWIGPWEQFTISL